MQEIAYENIICETVAILSGGGGGGVDRASHGYAWWHICNKGDITFMGFLPDT